MTEIKNTTHFISALFLALLVGFFYAQGIDDSLVKPGALVGIATFDGVDVAHRINSFYKMLILTGISFLGFTFLLQKIKKFGVHKWARPLSVLGVINVVYSFYNPENLLVSVVILVLLVTTLISVKDEKNRLFFVLISVSITVFITYFLREVDAGFKEGLVIFIWVILLIGFLLLDEKLSVNTLFPLLALPLLEPIGNETFLILNQHEIFITTPIGWILLYFIMLLIWLVWRSRKTLMGTSKTESKFIYLSVFSLAVFTLYKPFYAFWGDLFELANPANAMMRHFVFGELPFVDYFSSHLLFEQIPQWVYVVLNGYQADVSFMIYAFSVPVLGVVISFWFFKQILSTEWAFAIVFLFPFTDVLIPPTFTFGLITIKLLFDYYQSKKIKNVYFLLGWILFITLWRIDFGVSIIPAIVILFVLDWWQSKDVNEIKTVLIHSVIFIGGLGIVAFIINLSTGGKLFENLPLAFEYLGASQAHAYTEITKKFTMLFYLHYFLFPMLSVAILIHIGMSNWKSKSRFHFIEIATVFLGLFYLFNAQRGLVRHSFSEEYDLYISSVFFLFLSIWLLRFYSHNRGLIYTVFSFLLILGFHYSTHGKPKAFVANVLSKSVNAVEVKNTQEKINRVIISDEFDTDGYQRLSNFINTNLPSNETFIDFSHTPMLYFLTQRKVPSYFNQYIQNTVSTKLLQTNVSRLEDIGLVVFGHSPRNAIDALDGVPNELRYFPVTEYIYQNFAPITEVNGYRIWMPKEAGLVVDDSTKMLPIMKDDLRNWPYYLGQTENYSPVSEVILEGNQVLMFNHQPSLHDAFEIEFKEIPENSNHAAWIEYFNSDGELLGEVKFNLKPSKESNRFNVPIGYQFNWQLLAVARIEFKYPDYLVLKSIKLVRYEP